MGKCEFIILKGKKKGLNCDMYTSKKNNGKYYCNAHIKIVENPKEESKEEPKQNNDDKIFNIDFDNCNDLDLMINRSFEKSKNTNKIEDNQSIKNCLHQVLNKLDIIENMIQVKKYKYNPIDEIPEIAEFKL